MERAAAAETKDPSGADRHPLPLSSLQIDGAAGTLSNGADRLVVGVRGTAILSVLKAHLGDAVPTQTLIDAGWPGYIVEEGSLSVQIASLRRALERLLGGTRWIVTVPRVGYRLVASASAMNHAGPGRWEPPTLAVLPLAIHSADPAAAVAAGALGDTLTSVLALHGGLSVAPRSTAQLYGGSQLGIAGIAADMGVRYLIEGGWQDGGTRPRVTLHLADAVQGRVIWAERFDFDPDDPLAFQDRIAARLTEEIDVLLVRGEEARIGYLPSRNLAAWSHYIRGLGHAYWPRRELKWGHEMLLAIGDFEKALALDPDSPALLASLGAAHAVLAAYGNEVPPQQAMAQAMGYFAAALERDADQPIALAFLALARSEQDRFDEAAALARQALKRAPHAPAVSAVAAVALCAAGAAGEAVAAVDRALAASPFFPSIYGIPLARAWRSAGRVTEAIRLLEDLDSEQPKFDCRELVLAYKQAGRHDDAVNAATRLLLREPGFTVTGWLATQHRADRKAIRQDAEALRAVGLPD